MKTAKSKQKRFESWLQIIILTKHENDKIKTKTTFWIMTAKNYYSDQTWKRQKQNKHDGAESMNISI